MKQKLFFAMLATILLAACSSESSIEQLSINETQKPHFVSLEDALKNVDPIFESMTSTRSGKISTGICGAIR